MAGEEPADNQNPLEVVPTDVVDEPRVAAALERIPDETVRETVRSVIVAQSHIGPLPPAELLAEYDAVLPGLAREIVDNSKAEQTHRHTMDSRTGNQEFALNIIGLVVILIALAMMLGVVAFMVVKGAAIPAATLGVGVIVGVVVALTNYRKSAVTPMPSQAPASPDSE